MKKSPCQQADTPRCKRGGAGICQRGFSLIELFIVISLIVLMTGIFLDRFKVYQEQAEKAMMEGMVSTLQSSLTMQYAQILTRGKPGDAAALVKDNPINWLQRRPLNYAGEFYDPKPGLVETGNWLFDLKSRQLIYVLHKHEHFRPGSDGLPWIRFHAVILYEPSRLPSLQASPELTSVLFVPVEPYVWF
jgi:general secretion pathway protein G